MNYKGLQSLVQLDEFKLYFFRTFFFRDVCDCFWCCLFACACVWLDLFDVCFLFLTSSSTALRSLFQKEPRNSGTAWIERLYTLYSLRCNRRDGQQSNGNFLIIFKYKSFLKKSHRVIVVQFSCLIGTNMCLTFYHVIFSKYSTDNSNLPYKKKKW